MTFKFDKKEVAKMVAVETRVLNGNGPLPWSVEEERSWKVWVDTISDTDTPRKSHYEQWSDMVAKLSPFDPTTLGKMKLPERSLTKLECQDVDNIHLFLIVFYCTEVFCKPLDDICQYCIYFLRTIMKVSQTYVVYHWMRLIIRDIHGILKHPYTEDEFMNTIRLKPSIFILCHQVGYAKRRLPLPPFPVV